MIPAERRSTPMYTTLNMLTQYHPCQDGLRKFLDHWGRDYGRDTSISIAQILESNGLNDALWCLQAVEPAVERDRAARMFACDCAEHVLDIYLAGQPEDGGLALLLAIHIVREYADGRADAEDLAAAWAVAGAAGAAAEIHWQIEHLLHYFGDPS